ncbi:UDP-galactopyranose mutase [Streptomyces hydrogenans]|uniref:UDP-galactopyranose mutase n=1 Tax=Streptomyces hydrogenans TaxID=1873719 RepID=UPI0037FA0F3D
MTRPDIVTVGAGLSGLVIADRLSTRLPGASITVLESTGQTGGLCTTLTDPLTGVTYNPYGTHVLATSDPRVWKYVSSHTEMASYQHRVWADIENELIPLPLGLEAISRAFGTSSYTTTADQARALVDADAAPHRTGRTPTNAEEAALAAIGPRMYEMFVRGHITKQWGAPPDQLDPGVFTDRFGIQFTPTTGYRTNARWQGFPSRGWGDLFARLTDNPRITVLHNTPATADTLPPHRHACVVTTPIDAWFDFDMGTLERGRISFTWQHVDRSYAPHTPVTTYPDPAVPHYRAHSPEYLPDQLAHPHDKVLVGFERHGEGQFPIDFVLRTQGNRQLADAYRARARHTPGFHFTGRGTTFHDDMATTITSALALAEQIAQTIERSPAWP